ncbi:5-methylcytosine-specific restriction enzyme subunit McrC [Paenibacillus sp. OK060]|nr:5-methylcytosine-specific restriction enzyme subunit McrC [Paenibacillus sp. OK060]
MGKILEIKEHDVITCNKEYIHDSKYKYLDDKSFSDLENLVLTFNNKDADAIDFFSITTLRNVGKVIRAKNYVGIVQLKSGTQIQILPKIEVRQGYDTKIIFLRMLKSMKDFPSKIFNETNLSVDKMDLYEIFIKLYILELRSLLKKGLQGAYHAIEDNNQYYKGKLLINEHIKQNVIHKERFYVQYDEFSINRAENRLIKATLLILLKKAKSLENIKEMKQMLSGFERVEASNQYEKDFSQVVVNRNSYEYTALMKWSKVFLSNKSLTTFSGVTHGRALLFPMEKVFESFVGNRLRRAVQDRDWNISLQDHRYYLFENQFAMKPDIVLEKKDGSRTIILDTKWKRLNAQSKSNYGIAQSDMYQMYAYAKKYSAHEVWLLYPIQEELMQNLAFKSNDQVWVKLFFIDLCHIEENMNTLISLIES